MEFAFYSKYDGQASEGSEQGNNNISFALYCVNIMWVVREEAEGPIRKLLLHFGGGGDDGGLSQLVEVEEVRSG